MKIMSLCLTLWSILSESSCHVKNAVACFCARHMIRAVWKMGTEAHAHVLHVIDSDDLTSKGINLPPVAMLLGISPPGEPGPPRAVFLPLVSYEGKPLPRILPFIEGAEDVRARFFLMVKHLLAELKGCCGVCWVVHRRRVPREEHGSEQEWLNSCPAARQVREAFNLRMESLGRPTFSGSLCFIVHLGDDTLLDSCGAHNFIFHAMSAQLFIQPK
jgi:hypothetical protein